jgi:hypothetical protein
LLEALPIRFAREELVRLVFLVPEVINIVVGAILPDDRRR